MAARRLNTYVHVHVDGVSSVFGPDDKVPADVAKLITNDAVWDDGTEEEVIPPTPAVPDGAAAVPSDPAAVSVTPPPKAGKGSGLKAWREFANAVGFETDDDASREEIIDVLGRNGVATE